MQLTYGQVTPFMGLRQTTDVNSLGTVVPQNHLLSVFKDETTGVPVSFDLCHAGRPATLCRLVPYGAP